MSASDLSRHSRSRSGLSARDVARPALDPAVLAHSSLTRRGLLQLGSLGLGGMTLPRLLWADERRASLQLPARADHCIVVFLNGGPPQLDTWDMKPDAPAEIRGEFQPIASSLPGIPVCEHLPRIAQHLHRCTIIRSAHHSVNNAHASAVYTALTGHDRGEFSFGGTFSPNDHPAIGSLLGMLRPPEQPIVPYVSLPYITKEGAGGPPQPGFYGGLMGKAYDPLFVTKDPNDDQFSIPELTRQAEVDADRLSRRRALRGQVDGRFSDRDNRSVSGLNGFQERALTLLTSEATQEAFQLRKESPAVREAYGRNIYGQSTLLARRLIESGTRLVCLSWAPDANATWDTHGQNFVKCKTSLLPQLDMAVGSLITDLVDRQMLDRTLIVVMGEFGRTPKINANAGRDHWNFCYSVLLAGGGMKPGFIYGASDKIGAFPAANPVLPAEIIATIYASLGIPHNYEFHDPLGRPIQAVPWAEPIVSLFA